MERLEDLQSGQPQKINDRSVLLAFSAWHVYPNLIWLGKDIKNIVFMDWCVNPRGVGTIVLEPRSSRSVSETSWSLTLSHLRYYSNAVTVNSDKDFSRVTIRQLHIVGLGSIFNAWNIRWTRLLMWAPDEAAGILSGISCELAYCHPFNFDGRAVPTCSTEL